MTRPDNNALAGRLHRSAILLVRMLRDVDSETGLTPPQRSVLSRLINEGPHTLGQLAKSELVRPPTMTRIIQGLEEDGYIVRRKSPEDGRVSVVDYTSKAWTTLEKAATKKSNLLAQKVGALSEKESKTLVAAMPVLERLVDSESAS